MTSPNEAKGQPPMPQPLVTAVTETTTAGPEKRFNLVVDAVDVK